jgi:hypothetical protein
MNNFVVVNGLMKLCIYSDRSRRVLSFWIFTYSLRSKYKQFSDAEKVKNQGNFMVQENVHKVRSHGKCLPYSDRSLYGLHFGSIYVEIGAKKNLIFFGPPKTEKVIWPRILDLTCDWPGALF